MPEKNEREFRTRRISVSIAVKLVTGPLTVERSEKTSALTVEKSDIEK